MKLYIVVHDGGLNGPWVHGEAFLTREDAEKVIPHEEARNRRYTGYQGAHVEVVRVP